jgi:hypothetical protein
VQRRELRGRHVPHHTVDVFDQRHMQAGKGPVARNFGLQP